MAEHYDDCSEQEDKEEFEEEELEDNESEQETGVAQRPIGATLSVPFQSHSNILIDPLVEKVFEFSISLIIQRFSQGEGPHSPLLYFTSVMGIDLKNGGFRRASSYRPILAGLLWIMRLLILEYALPKRAYVTLGRLSREAYEDHPLRLEEFRRPYLIQGCTSPASQILRMLAHAKKAINAEGGCARMAWDPTQETFYIDAIECTVEGFKHFVHAIVESAQEILQDFLFFEVSTVTVNLNSLQDPMSKHTPGYSLFLEPINRLQEGCGYMLSLIKHAPRDKRLLKEDSEEWDRKKVLEYLDKKNKFLELLMLAMLLTGGQPARGPELGSVKFQNSVYSTRNFFVVGGRAVYVAEYTKARAAANHSYYVARYLPPIVGQLAVAYIAYIRPFCSFLYDQVSLKKNDNDGDYLFCSEESPEVCWNGDELRKIFDRESKNRLHIRIIPSLYRHIAINLTKAHVKGIASHFEKDDMAWDQAMSADPRQYIYAFQAGHQRHINVSAYGLDRAYPSRLQPELLHMYLMISQKWYIWLGFADTLAPTTAILGEQAQSSEPVPSTPPPKRSREIELETEVSPASKRLMDLQTMLAQALEGRRAEKRLRQMLNRQGAS